jgi:hypothetical protein
VPVSAAWRATSAAGERSSDGLGSTRFRPLPDRSAGPMRKSSPRLTISSKAETLGQARPNSRRTASPASGTPSATEECSNSGENSTGYRARGAGNDAEAQHAEPLRRSCAERRPWGALGEQLATAGSRSTREGILPLPISQSGTGEFSQRILDPLFLPAKLTGQLRLCEVRSRIVRKHAEQRPGVVERLYITERDMSSHTPGVSRRGAQPTRAKSSRRELSPSSSAGHLEHAGSLLR